MRITPEKRRRVFILIGVSVLSGLLLIGLAPQTWKAVGYFLVFVWLIPGAFVLQYFAKPRQRIVAALPTFRSSEPLVPHAQVHISFERPQRPNATSMDAPVLTCLFVAGTEGFSARIAFPDWTQSFEGSVQFLFPEKALTRLTDGAQFAVLVGNSTVGRGQVITTHG